jgi:prepilin-type N-terminal cleavage/methylation domain-containing protein
MSDQEREDEQGSDREPSRPRAGVWWRRRSPKRDQRGLTLVELMIVVTIIAIIAAVAIAIYQDIVKKSKLAADQAVVASLRSAVAIYYGKSNGLFPGTMGAVEGLVQPMPVYNCSVAPTYDSVNGKITFNATIDDCP